MSPRPVAATFTESGDGRDALSGTLDCDSAASVLEAGRKRWSSRPRNALIRLDLSGLGRVDSSALAVLVAWKRWARSQGRDLAYVAPPSSLADLARLSGIGDLFEPTSDGAAPGAQPRV